MANEVVDGIAWSRRGSRETSVGTPRHIGTLTSSATRDRRWLNDPQRLQRPPVVTGSSLTRVKKRINWIGGPLGFGCDPITEQCAFLSGEFLPACGRHLGGLDPFHKQAVSRITRFQNRSAVATCQRSLATRQVQATLVIGRVVALQTILSQQDSHPGFAGCNRCRTVVRIDLSRRRGRARQNEVGNPGDISSRCESSASDRSTGGRHRDLPRLQPTISSRVSVTETLRDSNPGSIMTGPSLS